MRTTALIRSGWWVAVAAVVVSALTVWIFLSVTPGRNADTPAPAAFDFSTATVDPELIVRVMPPDGLKALDDPKTLSPSEIDRTNEEERGKLLVSEDRVIGVARNGEARAYPLRLMRWHEVVNDVVGGDAVAVTYGPLGDSVAVFSRSVGSEIVTLGVSGQLYQSTALLYDRRLEPSQSPLWVQLTGRAVAGPDPANTPPLEALPAQLTTWQAWRALHPDTRVMAPDPDTKQLYKRDPYHSYFGSDTLRFPVAPLPPDSELRLKDRIVLMHIEDTDYVFALPHLAAAAGSSKGKITVMAASSALEIVFDTDIGVAYLDAKEIPEHVRSVRHAFWFASYALEGTIPDTIRSADADRRQKTTSDS